MNEVSPPQSPTPDPQDDRPKWIQALDRLLGPCPRCGKERLWYNDLPLRTFCWGRSEAEEHEEWSVLVPPPFNPYLPGYRRDATPESEPKPSGYLVRAFTGRAERFGLEELDKATERYFELLHLDESHGPEFSVLHAGSDPPP